MEDNTALDKYKRVAHVEEFYDIIRDVHEKELLHQPTWRVQEDVR